MSGFCITISKKSDFIPSEKYMNALIDPVSGPEKGIKFAGVWQQVGFAVYSRFHSDRGSVFYENERIAVLCDAEIYDYREVSARGQLQSNFEAEIIAGMYHKHGMDWWKHINGIFSVCIIDKLKGQVVSYVDQVGVKRLVHYEDDQKVIIASRIASIAAAPGFQSQTDNQALSLYLSMEMIPTPWTVYTKIKKLESGHLIAWDGREATVQEYWRMKYDNYHADSIEEIKQNIFDKTTEAIRKRIDYGDGIESCGAFLSGGTDSGTITGIINELYPGKSKSFSIGFDEPGYDEMYYARLAAKEFNLDQTEYYVTPDDVFNQITNLIVAYDEPFANSSILPAFFCAKLAAEKNLTVLLGGDGGDEIFGGNQRYYDNLKQSEKYPPWLMKLTGSFINSIPPAMKVPFLSRIYKISKRYSDDLEYRIAAFDIYNYFDVGSIFEAEFLKNNQFIHQVDIISEYIHHAETDNVLNQYLFNDLKLTLMDNDLPKVNRMTELAGIRSRYPFLDIELIEYAARINPDLKIKGDQLRYIFKEAFGQLLPAEILSKKKHGFGLPIVPWMFKNEKLNTYLKDIIFDQKMRERGIFKPKFLELLYQKSVNDKTYFYGTFLYYIFVMEVWFREHEK